MPTYEYECKSCGHNFDVFQAMSDEPLKTCVKCGKEVRRLILGGAGVIFKGSGFYVTDKAGGKSAATSPAAKTEPAAKAESAAKTEATAKSDPAAKPESKAADKSSAAQSNAASAQAV